MDKFFLTRDGLKLFYRDYASQHSHTPVLCLHGVTSNSLDFADLAAHLQTRRRVLVPDQRGRGRSQHDVHWRNYHPGVYIEDMWALLRAESVSRVILIGSSLGGMMAMLMASMRPDAVVGVVLNDVGPEINPVEAQRMKTEIGASPAARDWTEAIEQMKRLHGPALPADDHDGWMALAKRAFVEDGSGGLRFMADPHIGDAIRALAAPPRTTQAMWQAFAAMRHIPLLVFRGEFSPMLPVDALERMQRENPHLIPITVPKRGHAPQLTEPECIRALDEFLRPLP